MIYKGIERVRNKKFWLTRRLVRLSNLRGLCDVHQSDGEEFSPIPLYPGFAFSPDLLFLWNSV